MGGGGVWDYVEDNVVGERRRTKKIYYVDLIINNFKKRRVGEF